VSEPLDFTSVEWIKVKNGSPEGPAEFDALVFGQL
jgi:hypothetical protein